MEYAILVVAIATAVIGAVWLARRRGRGWKRSAACAGCGRRTAQLLHGYAPDGRLWKGHVCACGGWECSACGHLNEPLGACCF